ncbi:MAG: sigma-70 family RNA polymerase sigma factor [Fimbriimonadaceae bacterium]|nr:sigma-70 family RNA polymerase sigma factor [Fimbriimonadaceae bacterium]
MSGFIRKSDGSTDAPLVRRAQQGDGAAWSELVDRYSGYVYTLLRSARVPEADQPDAFQYVFIELFKALADLRTSDYLAPWIRQTTIRHAIRVRKRSERSGLPLESVDHVLVDDDDDLEGIEQAERAEQLRAAVRTLSEKCQELIRQLFFVDPPRPYVEVAEALGIKAASLGMTRQRCLDALERAVRDRGVL